MISLLTDENFDRRIIRGLRLRAPALDYVIAQALPIRGASDPALLAWAAETTLKEAAASDGVRL